MSDEDDTSIHDSIREAMAETEVSEAVVSTETEVVETVSNRDESGRFKAKESASTQAAPESAAPTEAVGEPEFKGTWTPDRPPSSWTPAAREKWASLPPDIQAEITRREEATVNGVRQMQERFTPAMEFLSKVGSYAQEAQQHGVNFSSHVASVLDVERQLRTADVPAKFQTLMALADQFGVPLRDIINQSVGQQVLQDPRAAQAQIPPEFQRELAEMRNWREQQESQQVDYQVGQFGSDKEFFPDVRGLMADLIERNMAPNLSAAYEQAVWMHPGVREVMLSRQGQTQQSNQVAQRQKAAAGASIKSGGKVNVELADDPDDDIGDTIRKAWASSQGRV